MYILYIYILYDIYYEIKYMKKKKLTIITIQQYCNNPLMSRINVCYVLGLPRIPRETRTTG
jgi:L-cysteine desulfidase